MLLINQQIRLMKNNDIEISGIHPWNIIHGSHCKNIAMELTGNHCVIMCKPFFDNSF